MDDVRNTKVSSYSVDGCSAGCAGPKICYGFVIARAYLNSYVFCLLITLRQMQVGP